MSTVDDAVEAGAESMLLQTVTANPENASKFEWDRARRVVRRVQAKMWPVLSAGLRELHRPVCTCGNPMHTNPDVGCPECAEVCHTCVEFMPCETITELDRIDRELGINPYDEAQP